MGCWQSCSLSSTKTVERDSRLEWKRNLAALHYSNLWWELAESLWTTFKFTPELNKCLTGGGNRCGEWKWRRGIWSPPPPKVKRWFVKLLVYWSTSKDRARNKSSRRLEVTVCFLALFSPKFATRLTQTTSRGCWHNHSLSQLQPKWVSLRLCCLSLPLSPLYCSHLFFCFKRNTHKWVFLQIKLPSTLLLGFQMNVKKQTKKNAHIVSNKCVNHQRRRRQP